MVCGPATLGPGTAATAGSTQPVHLCVNVVEDDYFRMASSLDPVRYCIIGSALGAVPILTTYPLVFVKTRQQVLIASSSATDVILRVARDNGVRALYQGSISFTLGMTCVRLAQFGAYDAVRSQLSRISTIPQEMVPVYSGLGSGIAASAVMVPFEVISLHRRLQTTGTTTESTASFVRGMISKYGATAPFRGLAAAMWSNVPYGCLYFGLYAAAKARLEAHGSKYADVGQVVAAAASATVAATICAPLDFVRTNVQANIRKSGVVLSFPRYAYQIVSTDGLQALYRGAGARVLSLAPVASANLLLFDLARKWARTD